MNDLSLIERATATALGNRSIATFHATNTEDHATADLLVDNAEVIERLARALSKRGNDLKRARRTIKTAIESESPVPGGMLMLVSPAEIVIDRAELDELEDTAETAKTATAEKFFARITALPKTGNTYHVHTSDLLEIMAENGVTE